jgi:hypothetical protein
MASCAPVVNRRAGRVANPPQVDNLPYNLCRIPIFEKTEWHWAVIARESPY